MICPTCKAEGRESHILSADFTSTVSSRKLFYDEKGRFHHHNSSDGQTICRCSNGHEWVEHPTSKCWCGWPTDPNWKDAVEPDFRIDIDADDSLLSDAQPGGARCSGSWCPQCGPDAATDKNGCCMLCGSDAIGLGAERALLSRRLAKESLPYLRGLHSECPAHRGHASCEVCPEYGVCKLVLLVVATEAL